MALTNEQIARAIMLVARIVNEGVDEVDEFDEPLADTIISDDLFMECCEFIEEIKEEVGYVEPETDDEASHGEA